MDSNVKTLWVWDTLPQKTITSEEQTWLKEGDAVENAHRLKLANHPKGSFDRICSGVRPPHTVQHSLDLLATLVELAKPGAELITRQVVLNGADDKASSDSSLKTFSDINKNLKLAGFTNIKTAIEIPITQDTDADIRETFKLSDNEKFKIVEIKCETPNFQSGSSQKLSFAKKLEEKKKNEKTTYVTKASAAEKSAIWSLDNLDDEEVDLIDPDTLIDEEDLKKPDSLSLKVCGTTGKRKACADCSCGLAEELAEGKKPAKKSITSSCGSCYLGDAFRCASCPYLGMPAFKPGEKIQLSERQLKPEVY